MPRLHPLDLRSVVISVRGAVTSGALEGEVEPLRRCFLGSSGGASQYGHTRRPTARGARPLACPGAGRASAGRQP